MTYVNTEKLYCVEVARFLMLKVEFTTVVHPALSVFGWTSTQKADGLVYDSIWLKSRYMILAVRFDKMGLSVVQGGFLGTKNKKK